MFQNVQHSYKDLLTYFEQPTISQLKKQLFNNTLSNFGQIYYRKIIPTMKLINYCLTSIILFSLFSCNNNDNEKALADVLTSAKKHNNDLTHVLEHYRQDSLKLVAAKFLITNLPGYVMAKNEQALGQHENAETHLLHAIDIVPERIYPFYLLANLYADSAYYQPIKLKAAIDSVLTKEPKVESRAIQEMRTNVKSMLKNIE